MLISNKLLKRIIAEAIENNVPTPMYRFYDGEQPDNGQLISYFMWPVIATLESDGRMFEVHCSPTDKKQLIIVEPKSNSEGYYYGDSLDVFPEDVLQDAKISDRFANQRYFLEMFHQYGDNSNIDNGDIPAGWINVGTIPYEQYGEGDCNIWVNPENPNEFCFATPMTNKIQKNVPSYALDYNFKDEYEGTDLLDGILGKRTDESELEEKHREFLSKLNLHGSTLILQHDSPIKITDGYIRQGKKQGYSNNSDQGIYYWASVEHGTDPSNGQQYTYFTHIDVNDLYDMDTNPSRYTQIRSGFREKPFVGITWPTSPDCVCVVTKTDLPIDYVIDNKTGVKYDSEWNAIEDADTMLKRKIRECLIRL